MLLEIAQKPKEFIAAKPVLQQTAYWAKVKESQGFPSLAFELGAYPTGNWQAGGQEGRPVREDILLILQYVNASQYIAYVPYGPHFDPGGELRGNYLEELSESLRPHLPPGCLHIRYDLRWESPWVHDRNRYGPDNSWMGPPEPHVREMRMNFTTKNWKLRKSPSDVLPAHTVFVDIAQDRDELLGRMKPKTRYNIRLSKRKGVEVKQVTPENLDVWYGLYTETARRNGIYLHAKTYFQTVLETQAQHTQSPARTYLLLAQYNAQPLAGMILGITGHRATYLYGASGTQHRNRMPTYALQWEAMQRAAEKGCTEYDMFGISQTPDPAHPMYGLYRYKTRFGGQQYHRQGCWDYPLDETGYEQYIAQEMHSQGYHTN